MATLRLKTPRPVKGHAPWVRIIREKGPTPYAEPIEGRSIRGSRDVYKYCADMQHLEAESFVALYVDSQYGVIARSEVTRGILNASLVHPREVFRLAIAVGAAYVILAHNHPSGNTAPSADDRAITSQLVDAGKLLDIPVLDHIIIGAGNYISFAEQGML